MSPAGLAKKKNIKQKRGKKPSSAVESEKDAPEEKFPMKTSSDVISRIIWDPELPSQHFVVGYLDRMLGIMERPFNEFDWSNFNQTDPEDAAVPRHRIQYFKYKRAVVWDRASRYDAVFGSAGQPTRSVFEIMVDQDQLDPFCEDSGSDGEEDQSLNEKDSEDASSASHSSRAVKEGPHDDNHRKSPYDYFIAVPISDPRVVGHVGKLQENLSDQFPEAVSKMCHLSTLHVTLLLIKLHDKTASSDAVSSLVDRLREESSAIAKLAESTDIQLAGLTLLKDRIPVSMANKGKLKHLVQHLHNAICASGLACDVTIPESFHLTIGRFKKANRPEAASKLNDALGVSRFNCTCRLSSIVFKRVGVRAEPVFSIYVSD